MLLVIFVLYRCLGNNIMGMDLDLYVYDGSVESQCFSRSFKDEIIFDWYVGFESFLTKKEIEIVSPNTYGEIIIGEGKYIITSDKVVDRERNPYKLKEVLVKIEQYMKTKSSELPLVHFIYEDFNFKEELYSLNIDGVESIIEGDLFYYENYEKVRNKIQFKSYLEDYGKIDFLIEVTPQIEINNQRFYTRSITKAKLFEGEFKQCYDFLDEAIKQNKKVLWEFG
ncbi:hypothetical protein [Tenacibaculum sp. 190524A02b]|uniref:hypothetical protein n=1 Tax=Tenacibaculum vairaonense TaxID=3137860 RepID=UPI0032B123A1